MQIILAVQLNDPDQMVGLLALLVLTVVGGVKALRWFWSGPTQPDPWDDQVAAQLANSESLPICHRCLTPHDRQLNFCRVCGAPVGAYTNLLPFICLFSIGHTLRIGTSDRFRRSPLTVAGFFLLAITQYAIFAPVYWFVFFERLLGHRSAASESESVAD